MRLEFDPLEGIELDALDALDPVSSGECSTLERTLIAACGDSRAPATNEIPRETGSDADGASDPHDRD